MRHTKLLAVQAGSRLLLQATAHTSSNGLLPEGGELTPQQRLLFTGISVGLTVMAGLMSGLTLGLMSLDAGGALAAHEESPLVTAACCQWCSACFCLSAACVLYDTALHCFTLLYTAL
jgi:hypothetical protein